MHEYVSCDDGRAPPRGRARAPPRRLERRWTRTDPQSNFSSNDELRVASKNTAQLGRCRPAAVAAAAAASPPLFPTDTHTERLAAAVPPKSPGVNALPEWKVMPMRVRAAVAAAARQLEGVGKGGTEGRRGGDVAAQRCQRDLSAGAWRHRRLGVGGRGDCQHEPPHGKVGGRTRPDGQCASAAPQSVARGEASK